MGFSELINALWRGRKRYYVPVPAVAPPVTHKVETKWTPISHNEPLRKTCGKLPSTLNYFSTQCKRDAEHTGTCDHVAARKTCGFVPPTPGYAPCMRFPHSDGPCAHPLAKDETQFLETRRFQKEEIARIFNVPPHLLATHSDFAEIDTIAQRLHREYRATSKALKGTAKHDHGWKHCRQKQYFWNRARQWRKENEQRRIKDRFGEYVQP